MLRSGVGAAGKALAVPASALASLLAYAVLDGCSLLLDFDGYQLAAQPDAGSEVGVPPPPVVVASGFHDYRFARGPASFAVAADVGLLKGASAQSGESLGLSSRTLTTSRGGRVELAPDGSFIYTPGGVAGAFWGDDVLEYTFEGATAPLRARLSVLPERLPVAQLRGSGAGYGIGGAQARDGLGTRARAFAAAGDVNGDGLEDFVIGIPGPNSDFDGLTIADGRGAYIAFGTRQAADISLGKPPAGGGFFLRSDGDSDTPDSLGDAVAWAGDVNGDGFDDVIIGSSSRGSRFSQASNAYGGSYVVFGKADTEDVSTTALLAGQGGGFAIVGSDDHRLVGYDVAGAGDVNGDGLNDLLVTVPQTRSAPERGSIFVVFGKLTPEPAQLADVERGVGGFALIEDSSSELWGLRAAGLGDVNGDGLDDIGIGSVYPDLDSSVGRTWVVYGRRDPAAVVPLGALAAEPSLGFVISGADALDFAFEPVRTGDVDGDGIDDILVAASQATLDPPGAESPADAGTPDAGAASAEAAPRLPKGVAYVVFGRKGVSENVELRDVERGSQRGFAISGPDANAQLSYYASAGDLDGDGRADLVLTTEPTNLRGLAYVVYGSTERSSIDLANPPASRVLAIDGPPSEGACGLTVSGADSNGDGLDDLLISSLLYPDAPQAAGGAYLAFSWDRNGALEGRDRALIGSAGDDLFDLPALPVVVVRGGNGIDTLRASSGTAELDLRLPGRYQSIEVIDVRGAGPQRVLLDDNALRRLPQNQPGFAYSLSRRLTVLGDAEDTLQFDRAAYRSRGGAAGRLVYAQEGAYYGLEVSAEMRLEAAPTGAAE